MVPAVGALVVLDLADSSTLDARGGNAFAFSAEKPSATPSHLVETGSAEPIAMMKSSQKTSTRVEWSDSEHQHESLRVERRRSCVIRTGDDERCDDVNAQPRGVDDDEYSIQQYKIKNKSG